ncbi:MAG TPA: hypothetical protein VNI84_05940 [Pyrinomonadaceae bacterium]|nr:hypothetical protein [Pyrinomonadaceae bacterium]
MRSFVLFGLIICSLVFLSACTLIQNFMVVNSSGEEIEIEYELKDSAFEYGKSIFLPERTSISNFTTWRIFQKEWEKMPTEQYSFDKNTKIFKVKIKPYEVVKIAWADPSHIRESGDKTIDLKTLRINGNNKEIYFENSKKLLEEFKKNDFQIIYR